MKKKRILIAGIAVVLVVEETGGELFHIVPKESYGEDYETCADRAKNELDNEIRPELSSHIDADIMAQYDVI